MKISWNGKIMEFHMEKKITIRKTKLHSQTKIFPNGKKNAHIQTKIFPYGIP